MPLQADKDVSQSSQIAHREQNESIPEDSYSPPQPFDTTEPGVCNHPETGPVQQDQYAAILSQSPSDGQSNIMQSTQEPVDMTALEDGVDLAALNYLASNPLTLHSLTSKSPPGPSNSWGQTMRINQIVSPTAQYSVAARSPEAYPAHYPDAAYKELHSQLHDHMVKTARNTQLSRRGEQSSPLGQSSRLSPFSSRTHGWSDASSKHNVLPVFRLGQQRYIQLWQNYLEEIAPWLDMFDSERHFLTTVASMAKRVNCLDFSILALSARQLERKSPGSSHTESISLYGEAIRLIVGQLSTLNTEVIAACVLLCVLEMMSSSPKAWAKHLDGCAMLLEAAGVNGVVGGVRQAIFWCFARMDLWGGFLGESITKIPTNRWFISTDSMSSAISQFKGRSGGCNYANYAVFLCASVVNVVSNKKPQSQHASKDNHQTFVSRWKALFDLLEDWYADRPEEMIPLMTLHPLADDLNSPFSTIIYSTPAGANGNQLYHASMLLLLQDKPREITPPKSHKTSLWHARHICGIAFSNNHHGALINALQPLWIAGKLMSHRSEHSAILDTLERLERETGWASSWRADDLREFWGEYI